MLTEQREQGIFEKEEIACYYLYRLTMNGREQTGLVACASIDDYLNGTIKKHENTREEKEQDRIRHVDVCNAQTGPIFLAYRSVESMEKIVSAEKKKTPLYDFVSEDGIGHTVWKIDQKDTIQEISRIFGEIKQIYIADGHHRAASAVKVGVKRRKEAGTYTGNEEFNYFLSVLFPENELKILPYYRVVKDLNGLSEADFIDAVSKKFEVSVAEAAVEPENKAEFGMYLNEKWYRLTIKEEWKDTKDPVESLDVSLLQKHLLGPILGIEDPRTDKRIDFVGGIRGVKELERRVHTDMKVAFSTYPTSITELFDVADANLLMPPKSTWFEPKLRSGIFIHELSE